MKRRRVAGCAAFVLPEAGSCPQERTFISVFAIDRNLKCRADLPHALVADALDEHADRHALYRIEIGGAAARNRVVTGFENDFTGEAADDGGARPDERSAEPANHGVARQDDDMT